MKETNNKNKPIQIDNLFFEEFLESKQGELFRDSRFKETEFSERLSPLGSLTKTEERYLFAYDEKHFLDFDEFINKQKSIKDELKLIEKFTNVVKLEDDRVAPLGFLLIRVFSKYLVLENYEARAFWCDKKTSEWHLPVKKTNTQLLHFNSLDLVYKKSGLNTYYKEVRLGFGGIGCSGLRETVFKGLPLFFIADDFERDKGIDLPTTITYGDLLRAQRDGLSKKDILQKHLKNAKKLENIVNVNKFTLTEAYTLIKAVTEFDDKTFVNFVKWFREKGRKIQPPKDLPYSFLEYRNFFITVFILDTIGEFEKIMNDPSDKLHIRNTDSYITASDYIRMCRTRRRKLKIDFSSMRKLEEKHNRLFVSIRNKEYKNEYSSAPFEIHKEYAPLLKIVRKRDNPFKYLSKPIQLLQEGDRMHHCVGTYIGSVKGGFCVILTVDLEGVHYTLEVRAVEKDQKLVGYHLAQMQTAYNNGVDKEEHRNFVITFLNKIPIK